MKRKAVYPVVFAAIIAALFINSTPVRASEADDAIEKSFKETYVYMTFLKDDAVKIAAKDGVVTLTGTTADESNRALAQVTASNLPGVTGVDNQLATKAEVAAENTDLWIARKAKLALLFHRNVNAGKTIIDVKDKVVTLKGEASSSAQKELTGEYVKDIAGVTSVKNEMTVAAAPVKPERTTIEKMDDASVSALVKTVLVTHASTSSIRTKVETRNGEVTLTGIARNAAEISLVSKLIADVQGVTTVKNLMTVDATATK